MTLCKRTGATKDASLRCVDDDGGKELQCSAVRHREERRYFRDLGDEKTATDRAEEEESLQTRSAIVAREFNSGDRPGLRAGTESNNLDYTEALAGVCNNVHRRAPRTF